MTEGLVFLSGIVGGVIAWLPCSIGVAAQRYQLGGAVIRSRNKWVLLAVRPTATYSIPGQMVFLLVMLSWAGIFFGALVLPAIVARVLEVPLTSLSLKYAIYANFVTAIVAMLAGPAIWRKVALEGASDPNQADGPP